MSGEIFKTTLEVKEMFDPFREISRLDRQMDRLMRNLWGSEPEVPRLVGTVGEALPAAEGLRIPSIDLKETDKDITVIAELPGIGKDDIKIDVQDKRVEIRAERKEEKKEEKEGYILKERREGAFYRSFNLPARVNVDKSKATFKDGILSLKMPKSAIEKKTQIAIE